MGVILSDDSHLTEAYIPVGILVAEWHLHMGEQLLATHPNPHAGANETRC